MFVNILITVIIIIPIIFRVIKGNLKYIKLAYI